ncbi:hypothetical protein ACQ4PT_052277 [Festuca glaucescens]
MQDMEMTTVIVAVEAHTLVPEERAITEELGSSVTEEPKPTVTKEPTPEGTEEKKRRRPFLGGWAGSTRRRVEGTLRACPRAVALLAALGSRAGGRVRPLHRRAACVSPFSSLPASQPSAADAQLLRVINFEISSAQSDCRNPNWAKILGEDFPFEIKDKEGTNRITLTRYEDL